MCRDMKDSGVEWIGEIPEGWEVIRTKNIYSNTKSIVGSKADNYERLALTLNGVIKRSKEDSNGLQPEKFEGYQILKNNELVFKLIDLENVATSRVGISPYTGLVSPAYIILDNERHSRFGYYYFISMYYQQIFNKLGGDGVRSNLNAKDLLNIPYLKINEEERNSIVNYLDKKVSKIDDIISKQKSLIEKYKDYKQSLITETVTKGLNKNVPMKNSEIEWIGEIPNYWNIARAKNVLIKLNRELKGDMEPVICSNNGKSFMRGDKQVGLISMTENGYQGVEVGDLLIHGMDTWHGAIAISEHYGKCTPVVHVCDTEEDKSYIAYYLKSLAYRNVYKAISNGVRGNTSDFRSWAKVGEIILILPPRDEQVRIADFLDKKCNGIDSVMAKKEQLIEKLESYKKSLIYECVTGKREVN